MSLKEARRFNAVPWFKASCDDCHFGPEAMGMDACESMIQAAKAHRNETGHTTEVFMTQSLIIYRGVEGRPPAGGPKCDEQ